MKTKNLLTAMVLPALFAACTQDEFESMSQQTPMLNGRQLVENVTLNVEGAAETRLAYGTDGYSWDEGDQIGACLMDEITSDYRAEGKVWSQWFTLTDYIQTNYKFTRDAEGVWNTEAKLCEGNYFFAYPYNANMGLRDAYTFTAGEQVLEGTDKESLMKAYTENNSFVGYGKVEAGDKEGEAVAVTMIPVFGSTGITITNTGTNTYTIERVVLRGSKVFDKATVNPTTCIEATQHGTMNITQCPFNVAQYVQDPEEITTGNYKPTWVTYNKEAALRDVLDYEQAESGKGKVEVTINGNGTIQPQGSINVIAMVAPQTNITPTDLSDINKDQIVLDIYTDKGIISDIQLNHWYTANDANTSATTNVLTNDKLSSIGTGNKVEVTFDDTSLDKPATMDVYNEADLANLIHWNADQAKAITAKLKADVNITKEMYDELAGSAITAATIVGNAYSTVYSVTIEGDVADGALDAFKFDNVKEVLVNGTQSMKKSCASPIKVMSDATLNIAGNLTLAKDIENYGTLNVNAKVSGSSGLYIKNYSQMNVAAGKEIVKNVKVVNGNTTIAVYGTITNAGIIRTLSNIKDLTNGACGYVINTGIIGTEASVGELGTNENSVNNGRIDNNESGRVFLKSNAGDVYANATSTTRINDNSNGNIIITELDFNDGNFLTASGNMGNIVQEIAENASTSTVDVRANTLWLSATLTVDETNADGEYTSVDLTGSRMRNGAVTVVATGANARISGNYSTATDQRFKIDAIKVAANATLVLNNVFATIKAANNVTMSGAVNRPATLTINSNAVLRVTGDGDGTTQINVQGGSSNNVLDNNSNGTNIAF